MARQTKPLTDKEIKAAKPKEREYKLFDGGGLYLTVTPKNQKWWRLKFIFEGKEKRLSLGVYPQVSLQEARKRRENMKDQISQGINPIEERKEAKQTKIIEEIIQQYTFEFLANEYFEHSKTLENPLSDSHHEKQVGRIKNHCHPYIGKIPVSALEKSNILAIIRNIKDTGNHETARRVLSLIKSILNFGVDRGKLEINVANTIAPTKEIGKKVERHYPIITEPKALKALLLAIDEYPGDFSTKQALRIMPHVVLRAGNIRFAEWSEIDFEKKLWSIPASKMKMKEEHIVPLTDKVVEILRETQQVNSKNKYIFSSFVNNGPISENTLNQALRRMGYTQKEIVSHSFRGIFSTILHEKIGEHGFDTLVIEAQLAHKERNQVKAAYNHAKYIDDRRKMMEWWSIYLEKIKND